jgi:hypothetical protein
MSTETEWHTINVSKCLLFVVAIQSQAKYTQKIPGKLQLHKKEQRKNTAVGEKKLILETRSCVHVTQKTETKSARIEMLLLENSSIEKSRHCV